MGLRWNPRQHLALSAYVLKWLLIAAPVGAAVGSAVSLFLGLLEQATIARWNNPWLLYLLPVSGVAIGALYQRLGGKAEQGNNLIVDQIHEPGGGVPIRMAPLILAGTVITHLFGGSAGREGTAIQMGGSIASGFCRWLGLGQADVRTLLMAGVAAGFGAVFGTPLTGAIFALEVLTIGRMSYESLVPCLIASVVGDRTAAAWGVEHTRFAVSRFSLLESTGGTPHLSALLLGKVAIAAVAFGLASVVFAELVHTLHRGFRWAIPWPAMRPAVGGLLVIALVYFVGTRDYLGLGVSADPNHPGAVTIQSCFSVGGATWWSWWWKILFTTVTLGSGFKGGEVTPLFFIGAALGNSLARLLGAPIDLFAALGFVSVFAAATNTPLACTIMGIELFASSGGGSLQGGLMVYLAVSCCLAYVFSGHTGIYLSQRIGTPKVDSPELAPDMSLRTVRELQPNLGGILPLGPYVGVSRMDDSLSPHGGDRMLKQHKVLASEIGQVRIYMIPRDRQHLRGLRKLFGRSLFQEIIVAAKKDGMLSAVSLFSNFGYAGDDRIESSMTELPNQSLTLCVEITGHRENLEVFCRKHGELLSGKVIVYNRTERWDIRNLQDTGTELRDEGKAA